MKLKEIHNTLVYDEFGNKDYTGYWLLLCFFGYPLFIFVGLPLLIIWLFT